MICNECGINKPETSFYKLAHSSTGYNQRCKTCQNEYSRKRRIMLKGERTLPKEIENRMITLQEMYDGLTFKARLQLCMQKCDSTPVETTVKTRKPRKPIVKFVFRNLATQDMYTMEELAELVHNKPANIHWKFATAYKKTGKPIAKLENAGFIERIPTQAIM